MILNLAPVQSYHLDTLSSLNFANRTKKIEVREIENQPFYREATSKGKIESTISSSLDAPSMHRQPLRPKIFSQNTHLRDVAATTTKPVKQFAVYSDKSRPSIKPSMTSSSHLRGSEVSSRSPKRSSSEAFPSLGRPTKFARPTDPGRFAKPSSSGLSKDAIEALIDRKVSEALAERADSTTVSTGDPISDEVQKRLDALEKRVEGQESERSEGLQYLLMAKQHQVRGEDASALRMYQMALPYFSGNEKLARKVSKLQDKIELRRTEKQPSIAIHGSETVKDARPAEKPTAKRKPRVDDDDSYHEALNENQPYEEDDDFVYRPRTKIRRPQSTNVSRVAMPILQNITSLGSPPIRSRSVENQSEDELAFAPGAQTPRTKHLLDVINTKDVSQIKALKGVGAKRAETIVNCLCDLDEEVAVTSLGQLGKLKGVGVKTVENMRSGLVF